uniref:NADH-ubiquinone oxidoreductase chain 6 n=1 Tax=Carposina sasakii TaxID=252295 RepID=V9I0J6_CARSA|nr:NADH dehydrogenase subunit 6 [Carposina sasakii]ADZ47950.1 NADH dehydrogenase subunit 6 [Carposina sasakii]
MKLILTMFMITLSILMTFINNPMIMGLMILTQTLLTCLISGMLIKTYWFSYILFLTFLGGLLVLFIYVSSIASNEMFILSPFLKKMFFSLFMLNMLFMFMLKKNNLTWLNFFFNSDMENMFNLSLFINKENKMNLSKIYNNQTFLLLMMLIIYLFITLIAIVKITNIFYGPLRPLN